MNAGGIAILGNLWTGSGSFTDADVPGHTFSATVNYGDGGATVPLTLVGETFTLAHSYTRILSNCTITVTVTDNEDVSGEGSTTLTVLL